MHSKYVFCLAQAYLLRSLSINIFPKPTTGCTNDTFMIFSIQLEVLRYQRFRQWLLTYSAPSNYLNQSWLVNWTSRKKKKKTSVKFSSKWKCLMPRKCISKCCLPCAAIFIQESQHQCFPIPYSMMYTQCLNYDFSFQPSFALMFFENFCLNKELEFDDLGMISLHCMTYQWLDSFTVPCTALMAGLPAIWAVQRDGQWPLKNGGNSHQSHVPRMPQKWGID